MQAKVDQNAAKEIAEDYASSLSDLKISTKPLITMLTMLAEESQEYASVIVDVIEKHLEETQYKLPALYLIDSIAKNVGGEYKRLFSVKLGKIFTSAFKQVDEKIRKKMYELRQTWTDIFPASRLYWLDTSVAALDPAWPVTAQMKTVSQQPNIHFNPNFQGSHAPDGFPPPLATSSSPSVSSITEDQKELMKIQVEKKLLEQKKKVVLNMIKDKEKSDDSQGHLTIFVAPWKLKQLNESPTTSAAPENSSASKADSIKPRLSEKKTDSNKHTESVGKHSHHKNSERSELIIEDTKSHLGEKANLNSDLKCRNKSESTRKSKDRSASREKSRHRSKSHDKSDRNSSQKDFEKLLVSSESNSHSTSRSSEKHSKSRHSEKRSSSSGSKHHTSSRDSRKGSSSKDSKKTSSSRDSHKHTKSKSSDNQSPFKDSIKNSKSRHLTSTSSQKHSSSKDVRKHYSSKKSDDAHSQTTSSKKDSSIDSSEKHFENHELLPKSPIIKEIDNHAASNEGKTTENTPTDKKQEASPTNLDATIPSEPVLTLDKPVVPPEEITENIATTTNDTEKKDVPSKENVESFVQPFLEQTLVSSTQEPKAASTLPSSETSKDVDLRVFLGTNFPDSSQNAKTTSEDDATLSLFGKEDVDLRQLQFPPAFLPSSATASSAVVPPVANLPPVVPTSQTSQVVPSPLEFQDPAIDDDDIIFVGSGDPANKETPVSARAHTEISKEMENFFQACLNQLNDDLHFGKITRSDYNLMVQDLYLAKSNNQLEEFQKRTQLLRTPKPELVPTLQPPPLPPRFPVLPSKEEESSIPFPPMAPPPMLDVHSLLAKLQTTGIIEETPEPKENSVPASKPDPPAMPSKFLNEVPDVEHMFQSSSLKKLNRSLIQHLYSGTQCSSCGLRIPSDQKTVYSRHLDWHFRMNKKQQESTRKANIRKLYLTVDQWIQYEEIDQTKEPASTVFDMVPRNIAESQVEEEVVAEEEIPSVSANPDEPTASQCPVCLETFSHFYDHNKEEWQYKNAIHMMRRNYHPGCWEDYERQLNDSRVGPGVLATEVSDHDDNQSEDIIEEPSSSTQPTSLPPIISALLSSTLSRGASPEILSPPPSPERETITVEDDSDEETNENLNEKATPVKIPVKEPQKVKIKIERTSDDEEMEVHIYPRVPRILADIPLKIEIKDEPEDLPPEETIHNIVPEWHEAPGDTTMDIEGNTRQPITTTDVTASAPVIRLNVGKNSSLVSKKSMEVEDIEEGEDSPIYDDPDYKPPPFTYDEVLKPAFKGVRLKKRPIDTIGYEMSAFCSIM